MTIGETLVTLPLVLAIVVTWSLGLAVAVGIPLLIFVWLAQSVGVL